MRKIEYVVSNERLITPSGLSLVGQVLGKSNLIKKANHMRTEKRSQPQIKNGDILLTMIGLLSLGKSDFENVNEFHRDEEFYKIVLGIAYGIPSESSLRNRLDGIGTTMNQKILDGNVDMFLSCGYEPSSLANGCVPVGSIIPAAIKLVSPAPTRTSTVMRPSSPTSEQRVISVMQSFVKAGSIARAERRNFFLKPSQLQSR